METKIRDLIKKQCKGKRHIKLTVGYIINGKSIVKVYGESGEEIILSPENNDYIYEIGSVTKTFTASILAKYIHEGKISLNDSIQKYIKGLPENRYFPTIKRLVTHTSGYKRSIPHSEKGFKAVKAFLTKGLTNETIAMLLHMDEAEMIAILKKYKLVDKEYKWQYCNFGISLIGYALGVISGKGYRETMDEYIKNDLGLQNSFTGTDPGKNIPGYKNNKSPGGNWIWGDNLIRPAGDISSTAKDLLRYAEIHFNNEFPYLSICHQKYVDVSFPFNKMYDIDMGLGWWIGRSDNNTILHGGDTAAFSSILITDKKHKSAVVVLSNYPVNSAKLYKIAKPLLQHINR